MSSVLRGMALCCTPLQALGVQGLTCTNHQTRDILDECILQANNVKEGKSKGRGGGQQDQEHGGNGAPRAFSY